MMLGPMERRMDR